MTDVQGFSDLVNKLNEVKKLSATIEKSWTNISKSATSTSKVKIGGASGQTMNGGQKGVGGGANTTSTSMGDFSSGHDSFAPSGMASRPGGGFGGAIRRNFLRKQEDISAGKYSLDTTAGGQGGPIFGLADVMDFARNTVNSMNGFLPNVGATMNRATSYYNAGIYQGSAMSRTGLQQATFGTLAKMRGLTSAGSDAQVAQFLAGRGMTASTAEGSTYQQTLRSVANAGRYLNISNAEAAASIEGMTSAQGASETLRNFGIYTADLSTGKEKTQGQIFEELAGRLTAGRGQATVEQTQMSLRRGALGVTVDRFFQGDEQGATMFKQYMIERARGKNMDLSSATTMDKAIGTSSNYNPLNAQMTLASKQTGAMQAAEPEYIRGINAATGALSLLTAASGQLAKALGGASAMFQTLFGNEQFKSLMGGMTGLVNYSGKAIGSAMQLAAPAGFGAVGAASAVGVAGLAGAGLVGTLAGIAGAELITKTPAGANSNVTGTGGGSGGGSTAISGTGGGESAAVGTSPMFAFPPKNKINTYLGVKDKEHPNGHNGTDYSYREGDPIYAVANGTVIHTETSYKGSTYPNGPRSLGNMVAIKHTTGPRGDVYVSVYGHMKHGSVLVKKNDVVRKGQRIGSIGSTGFSTGPHLHFEIRKDSESGKSIDPRDSKLNALTTSGDNYSEYGADGAAGAASGMSLPTSGDLDAAKKFSDTLQSKASGVTSQASGALSVLQGLYSGNTSKMTEALSAMASGLGIPAGLMGKAVDAGLAGTPEAAPDAGTVITPGGPGGGGTNNNVTINVQVPDVTSADAVKFAQLVKQYLDSNTLMSNTGSI